MKQQEIISLLLSIQEQPEDYTDEQLRQLFSDNPELAEMAEQLAWAKRAVIRNETEDEVIPVDEEWETFAAKYANELDALDEDNLQNASVTQAKRLTDRRFYRIAAGFIGFLFIAGMAFAAIHIIRSHNPKTVDESPVTTIPEDSTITPVAATSIPDNTLENDTTVQMEPFIFDNVPVEDMLPQIAVHYGKTAVFSNEDARQLRFYFVWKPEEALERVLQRLNLFESIHVEQKEDKIVVE